MKGKNMPKRKEEKTVKEVLKDVVKEKVSVVKAVAGDVLKDLIQDPQLLEVVNATAQDLFAVSRGGNPEAKYNSWRELDKVFADIVATDKITRIAEALAKLVFDAVLMNWKIRQK